MRVLSWRCLTKGDALKIKKSTFTSCIKGLPLIIAIMSLCHSFIHPFQSPLHNRWLAVTGESLWHYNLKVGEELSMAGYDSFRRIWSIVVYWGWKQEEDRFKWHEQFMHAERHDWIAMPFCDESACFLAVCFYCAKSSGSSYALLIRHNHDNIRYMDREMTLVHFKRGLPTNTRKYRYDMRGWAVLWGFTCDNLFILPVILPSNHLIS